MHLKTKHDIVAAGQIENRSICQFAVAEKNLMAARTIVNVENGFARTPNCRQIAVPTKLKSIPGCRNLQIQSRGRPDTLNELGQGAVCVCSF
jgi:hypothetical protein